MLLGGGRRATGRIEGPSGGDHWGTWGILINRDQGGQRVGVEKEVSGQVRRRGGELSVCGDLTSYGWIE